jgi:predicted RNA-binding protein with TRAM domain
VNRKTKYLLTFLTVTFIALLTVSPIFSQGKGKSGGGDGQGTPNGNAHQDQHGGGSSKDKSTDSNTSGNPHQGQNSGSAPQQPATDTSTQSPNLLGCQKNNPSRLDCSSLDVTGVCQAGTAVFTITNTGSPGDGDMRAPTQYRIVVDGVVVETGTIQLGGGGSMQVTYSGSGGSVTLEADQQVGHPGHSQPRVTLDCGPATTPPPPPPPPPPNLSVDIICNLDGYVVFTITNNGGDMPDPVPYVVTDMNGNILDQNTLQLSAAQSTTLEYWGGNGPVTLNIDNNLIITNGDCPTTTEPPPTDTPPAPSLTADAACNLDGYVIFVVTNTGADMTDPVSYVVTDSNSNVIDQNSLQLTAGQFTTLEYWGGDSALTLNIADGQVVVTQDCQPPTTEPPPTDTPPAPSLTANGACNLDGYVIFVVTNTGADMTDPVSYIVTDANGNVIDQNSLQLTTGQFTTLEYWGGDSALTLNIADGQVVVTQDCQPPTTEPPPTDTPPAPSLTANATCNLDGYVVFTVTNTGGDMTDPVAYTVTDANGSIVSQSTLQLAAGQSTTLEFWGGDGALTLNIADGQLVVTQECQPPTTEPPRTEPPPTQAPLGCQKNNPDRLDCSTLNVKATCDGGTAVFTITNGGKPGEGDMRAPTQYRIIVDGVVVETGTVQLNGGASVQVTYSGGGTVTLEADQQIGHPGNSQPKATISCSS